MKKTYLLVACVFLFLFGSVSTTYASIHHYSAAYSKGAITRAAKVMHASSRDIADLMWMGQRESTFRNWAHSGGDCHGIFQLSYGMAHHMKNSWAKPYWNTKRAIRYMRGRYGSIRNARAFWSSHNWY